MGVGYHPHWILPPHEACFICICMQPQAHDVAAPSPNDSAAELDEAFSGHKQSQETLNARQKPAVGTRKEES